MTDQLITLGGDAASSQFYETQTLLATIARFARPNAWPPMQVERDLENYYRLAIPMQISFLDCLTWLKGAGVTTTSLDSLVAQASDGNPELLHQALQQATQGGQLSLLWITDASKLIEIVDTGDGQGARSQPFSGTPDSCLLLRVGYATDQPYGYYQASLAGTSRVRSRLTWTSLVDAGIKAVVVIPPPVPELDYEAVHQDLYIAAQGLITAQRALSKFMERLTASTPIPVRVSLEAQNSQDAGAPQEASVSVSV